MREVLTRVLHDIKYWQGLKEKKKLKRVVNAALERVRSALLRNPELASLVGLPVEEEKNINEKTQGKTPSLNKKRKRTTAQKRMVAKVLGPSAVISRLKLGARGISCQLDHFGIDSPESYTEGNLIYLNTDHPLYVREAKNRERQLVNIARLLTQEIALLKNPRSARQAFDIQSRLLKDSLVEK